MPANRQRSPWIGRTAVVLLIVGAVGGTVSYFSVYPERLPDWAARLQAALLQYAPGKPFTPDNYRSLQTPSVCDCNQLPDLGIDPTPMDVIVPGYLAPRDFRGPRSLL